MGDGKETEDWFARVRGQKYVTDVLTVIFVVASLGSLWPNISVYVPKP